MEKKKPDNILIIAVCILFAAGIVLFNLYKYFYRSVCAVMVEENQYTFTCLRLNGTMEQSIDLEAGQEVDITFVHTSGTLAAGLFDEEKNAVWSMSDHESGEYTVTVPADGTYTMAVSGSRGAGTVIFESEEEE